ncbi:MAG: hypothetical protein IJ188_00690 [Clostridia bacterium]|nr:hypothetical protein [Clostridia bacterium]
MKKLISALLACIFLWQAMPLDAMAEALNPLPPARSFPPRWRSRAFPTTRRATTAAWTPITA